MAKVKVCGITNLSDARAAAESGCDALGFNFYKKSPRYISPESAREIIRALPGKQIKVGVFVNARENTVRRIARFCGLDILQFHGRESPEFCAKFKGHRVIKAVRVKDRLDSRALRRYDPFAFLFDSYVHSQPGGTGRKFNWELVRHLDGIKKPVFLSGGLTEGNVVKAIRAVRPDWVDVASGVESAPGKKDPRKMRNFISAVKKA